ncbi:MAG: ParB N-terminal domain-containing protein [Melioribacteraceae bacterium]|nr:ParB N-terminal domain-containing protein [Melioribacteraceae bacterium]
MANQKSKVSSSIKVYDIPLNKIKPDENQPRFHFDEEKLVQLKKSIRNEGLINPITVEKISKE